ncbi:MAG: diaminopimelate decarboxylase, partial [Bacteroidaceae bacterium]|nr:diaminopimelate decarboxylase [Bacteroidaceae bacterium]
MFPIEEFKKLRTPFYYYDTDLLRQTLKKIRANTDPYMHVHYAVKACANPKVLGIIAAEGFGADCVSGGEIQAALNAGFPADRIVYAGVGKSDWEIELGLDAGIFSFNVESIPELEIINHLAVLKGKKARIALRINPNVGAHTHANITTGLAENKFGIDMQDMESVIAIAGAMDGVEFIGLHFHIGSQILEMDDFAALSRRINEIQDRLETAGIPTVSDINVGGGLGIDYMQPDHNPIPDFRSYFDTYRKILRLRPGQQLHFELGRAIVG